MRSRAAALLLAALVSTEALAGTGPWTLGQDDRSIYFGAGYTRWDQLNGAEGADSPGAEQLPSAFTRTDGVAIVTYGILPWAEFEAQGSMAWAAVGNAEVGVCSTIDDACGVTSGLAPVTSRIKARLLDELHGSPVSVAVGGEVRFADFTRNTRQRITSIGSGQTDLGAFVTAGRAGAIGSLPYSTWLEGEYRYRLPLRTSQGNKVPPDEIQIRGEALGNPTPAVSLGGTFEWLENIGGADVEEIDWDDPDRFTALDVTSFKVGGKLNLRSVNNVTISLSALGTVLARNNPGDLFSLGLGLGIYQPSKTRR